MTRLKTNPNAIRSKIIIYKQHSRELKLNWGNLLIKNN